jgi:hypothetical protein
VAAEEERVMQRVAYRIFVTLIALGALVLPAPAQGPSEAAQAMVGAWEISNAARDKTCSVTFSLDAVEGGFRLELDPACGGVFPSLKDLTIWKIGPNDSVLLLDAKRAIILDFSEVESRMYEAERKGEGLFFMRTPAAIRATAITPDQVFGDWTLLQEFEKPLCKVTLSNASAGGESYRIVIKPGCDPSIAALALATWRLDNNELLLSGRSTWRFAESDSATWERIPPSTDPMLLMRQ